MVDIIQSALMILFQPPKELIEVTILTAELSFLATFFSVLIGLPLGIFVYSLRSRFKNLLLTIINTGLAAPPVVVGLLIFLLLSNRGPLGFLDLLYTKPAIVIAEVFLGTPVVASLVYSSLAGVPAEKVLQLIGLGASRLQSVYYLLREARGGILASIMAAFGSVVSEVGAVLMVGGNIKGETRVLTTSIVLETRLGNYEKAIAFAIVLLLFSFLFNYVFSAAQRKEESKAWLNHIWR
ncbi:MAG: ABC transporter permease [Actinobacteria bacterium]|nr:ABC transporter permease [Actinomycetota bacterium]